jgi:hypothetical protein
MLELAVEKPGAALSAPARKSDIAIESKSSYVPRQKKRTGLKSAVRKSGFSFVHRFYTAPALGLGPFSNGTAIVHCFHHPADCRSYYSGIA